MTAIRIVVIAVMVPATNLGNLLLLENTAMSVNTTKCQVSLAHDRSRNVVLTNDNNG